MKLFTVLSISILSSTLFAQGGMMAMGGMMAGGGFGMGDHIFPNIESKIIQINGSETAVNAYKSEAGQKLKNDIQKSMKSSNHLYQEFAKINSEILSVENLRQSPDISKEEKENLKNILRDLKELRKTTSKEVNETTKDIVSFCKQYEEKFANKFYSIEGSQKSMIEKWGYKCKENEKMAGTDNTDNPCIYPMVEETEQQYPSQCGYPGMMGMSMKPQKLAVCVDKNNKITASAYYSIEKGYDMVGSIALIQNQSRYKFNGNKIVGIESESVFGKTVAEYEGSRTKVTQYFNGKKSKECTYEKGAYFQTGSEKQVPGVQ